MDADGFWDELAAKNKRAARVIEIFKKYNEVMAKAGVPYRYE